MSRLARTSPQSLSRPARIAAAALDRRWKLPAATSAVRVARDVDVAMRDGAVLKADVYLPDAPGPHPTVLMRSPYGRAGGFALSMAVPYAARGYAVVMQSVRGTFGSGGEFTPVVNEAEDAQDTVVWLREQPWFDGRLATLGPSYLAYTQWALALDPLPELKAMVMHIGPHDLAQAGMVDGAFQLTNLAIWTELIAHQERVSPWRGILRLLTAERRLAPYLGELPLQGLAERFGGNPAPWFDEWLAHPDLTDPYWDRYRATPAVHSSTVPTLLIGGWQDWFVEQTLEQYAILRDRGVEVGLTVGPWAHLTIDPAVSTIESLAWLNAHLPVKGANPVPPRDSRVRVFVTGARTWRRLPDWPTATTDRTWYLAAGGRLDDEVPAPGETTFHYDPMDPTPSVGGRVLAGSAGQRDNRELEARDDVRTFTTPALRQPVEVRGGTKVRLVVESDNPYADLFVRLCDVEPNGKSINITDRLVRLDPAPGEEPTAGERVVEATLHDTAHRFRAGHRIRLQVSGGAHPRYARNLGTGEPVGQATHGVPVAHRICHGGVTPSAVTLPTA
ncbi:CocE/NonD family hydrolase [Blastococcus sp. TF02A-35]|uniref:CocE/NonD family hydrolase n=1 Tax=Blastococcus sp. TF02A-35 TaxID=2559612 RepID=UPI001072FFC4|nr:CocE/NonD family hydrolase [Blastococcus sp. TF02A_35]TFV44859.1 CocE/NonD family hydrolase [Blastococcus sp. TF02A_35]